MPIGSALLRRLSAPKSSPPLGVSTRWSRATGPPPVGSASNVELMGRGGGGEGGRGRANAGERGREASGRGCLFLKRSLNMFWRAFDLVGLGGGLRSTIALANCFAEFRGLLCLEIWVDVSAHLFFGLTLVMLIKCGVGCCVRSKFLYNCLF